MHLSRPFPKIKNVSLGQIKAKQYTDPLFFRHLRLLLAVITALLMFSSLTLFFFFERLSRNSVYNQTLELLNQTASSTAELVETIQQITFQIQNDQTISPILLYRNATSGEAYIALEQLSCYQYIIQSLSSIYVYNGRTETWYTSTEIDGSDNKIISADEFPDQSAAQLVENYQYYTAYSAIPRQFNGKSYYTFIGYDFTHKNDNGELNCAVLVNVSAAWLKETVSSGTFEEGETIVINEQGLTISETASFAIQEDFISAYPEAESILGAEQSGFILTEYNNERMFVAYTAPDKMGWQYIRIIPYHTIMAELYEVRTVTLLLLTGFLLIGLTVSWFLNRKLYSPIDLYKKDISQLQSNERQSFFPLKNAFLRGLILSPEKYNKNINKKLKEFNCCLDPSLPVRIAVMITDRRNILNQFTNSDAEAYRFAILNIACELTSEFFKAEGVDLQQGRMALILSCIQPAPDDDKLSELFCKVRDAVNSSLSLSISIGISEPGDFSQLLSLYESANENLFQRLFTGDGSVLIGQNHNRMKDYQYPEKKEKLLTDALVHANYDRACKVYLEIIEECSFAPLYIFNTTVLRLVSTCNRIAGNLSALQEQPSFFINLSKFESLQELNLAFYSIFKTITDAVEHQNSSKNDQIASAVHQYISTRFSDPTLSIDAIADALGLSSSYLGRVYKSVTGHTILEHILEVRMQEARRLLTESTLSVAEISEQCGFSSDSYFYKIFRQENGTTPAAYRKEKH